MLKVSDCSLSFDETNCTFKNVSFEIEKNKITLLSGKSGCGKSSLLMCIAGLIPGTVEGSFSGHIDYEGEIMGYVFQDPDSQLCTFTVEDEIAFGLENLGIPRESMDAVIRRTLEMVHISNLRKRKLNQLSGGEKQKVALASVLALDPELILMDEPTANLDPPSTREVVELIRELKDRHGKTILLVEHKVEAFAGVIDRVLGLGEEGIVVKPKASFLEEIRSESKLPEKPPSQGSKEVVLEARDVSFSYTHSQSVLDDLSFKLQKGEIAAITGANGAGKSTLTKILMGLRKPDRGEILVYGEDIQTLGPAKLGDKMGLVFQNPEHQFIRQTVSGEVGFSLRLRGEDEGAVDSKVNEYLHMFGLLPFAGYNPFLLSQGQKRRLSTASMMVNGQKILILDEPTYGQDRENLAGLVRLLYQVHSEGTAVLMITHDMDLVEQCCHRVFSLENGRLTEHV